ncbi:MAG: hypothetical protein RL635_1431 [Chloroflexota bacterium]|jgi:cell division septum initiation protein DivIVA
MDILHLVDRLEELVNQSRLVPFTHNVLINEDRLIDIIDQMRVSVPDETKKAQKVLADRDRLLAQATEEAERYKEIARRERDMMVDQEQIVQHARIRAEQIAETARREAAGIVGESDEYATQTLATMETEIMRVLQQVRNGILLLRTQRGNRDNDPDAPDA